MGSGVVIIFAAPFLRNLAAYLDGRFLSPLFVTFWCLAFLAAVGFATFISVLGSRTLFTTAKQRGKYVLAFALLVGGPVWYFAIGPAPVVSITQGAADAAHASINVPALRSWAIQVLRDTPTPAADATGNIPSVDLPWERVPQDVRGFFAKKKVAPVDNRRGRVYIHFARDGDRWVEILVHSWAVIVKEPTSTKIESGYPGQVAELAPGVWLQLRIRP